MSATDHSRWKDISIPLISAAIALVGVLSGYVLNAWTERSQVALKTFEVTFPEKQKTYAKFMRLLHDSFDSAAWRQKEEHYRLIDELQASYYGIEPFLSSSNRIASWNAIREFIEFCDRIRGSDPTTDMDIEAASNGFTEQRDKIRALLFPALFERK